MIGEKTSRCGSVRRKATILATASVIAVSAYGPANLASGLGFKEAPADPPASIGYVPSSVPVRIEAPTARVYGLQKIAVNQVLQLADGSFSPPSVYLRVNRIDLDDTIISHTVGGHRFAITNPNKGDPAQAAIAGNDQGSIVEMWLSVEGFDLCVTPDTFYAVAVGYAGVFGGRLNSVLATIAQIFAQFQGTPLADFGPCLPLKTLLPLLEVFIDAGVPLPAMLPAENLDVYAYTIKVTTEPGLPSVTAPLAGVAVTQ
ncbi:hypothetical protein [Antrihabitans sp. YC2-6]|uniref:hypothetical protein n=1 Tax=Antrihabitans sp. YC2-6 TaxID=2799498 RepID=UPI0018F3F5B5|nr:hypothetical protein [Antrihabitans sp. YC2-6]MBJ8348442.1 hypothetical protein [Antrihabitans sp. YC2-6]